MESRAVGWAAGRMRECVRTVVARLVWLGELVGWWKERFYVGIRTLRLSLNLEVCVNSQGNCIYVCCPWSRWYVGDAPVLRVRGSVRRSTLS